MPCGEENYPLGRNHFLRLRPPHLIFLHTVLTRPSIKTPLFSRKVSVGQGEDGTRITRGEDLNFSFSTLRPQRILLFP